MNFREKSFDDWKAAGPHEDMPSEVVMRKRETCEVCGASVPGISVAKCVRGHFSYHPSRPERRGGK